MVRDANGKARYYEGFVEEITARKEAEAAYQQSQQRLIETSRQIGLAEITTGLLHNIGNALNSINISAGVVAGKVSSSKVGNLSKAINMMRDHEANLAIPRHRSQGPPIARLPQRNRPAPPARADGTSAGIEIPEKKC